MGHAANGTLCMRKQRIASAATCQSPVHGTAKSGRGEVSAIAAATLSSLISAKIDTNAFANEGLGDGAANATLPAPVTSAASRAGSNRVLRMPIVPSAWHVSVCYRLKRNLAHLGIATPPAARRDTGRYYLHQVDRDYALGHIPPGQPDEPAAGPVPFTRYALQVRAADYFKQTRTPRDSWRNLDDLAAQLAEFDLRYANADYDAAAAVLADIDLDYLRLWGHYRLAADMHERLLGRLTDAYRQMTTAGALGNLYSTLGQTERAIEPTQQALAIARETGNRLYEGLWLGTLGEIYRNLGQIEEAMGLTQQALAIARETGNREIEGAWLVNLGDIYRVLGQTEKAVGLNQRGLAIARETGNREIEGLILGGLGSSYATLGQTQQAIEHYQQALAIARETGNRGNEGSWLGGLGNRYATLGQIQQAIEHTSRPWPSPARPATAATKAPG